MPDRVALYRSLVSFWKEPGSVVIEGAEPPTLLSDRSWPPLDDFVHLMMYLDHLTYLPDDILVKVDRASMGGSLEARAPFLDHRLVELAWTLPLRLKARGGKGKLPIRKILARHAPAELFERPKMGFGVPIGAWLRGPLREWAEDLLSERRLSGEGLLRPAPVRRLWAEHLSGQRDRSDPLWCVLMLEAWLEEGRGRGERDTVPTDPAASFAGSRS
jgi:asparagine synthase (glutamine-hydrolysing)